MKFIPLLAMHAAGSVYEIITGRSHTQRTIKRKAINVVRRLKGQEPLRSWEDGRTNTPKRSPAPSIEECERLNREAARSI